MSRVLPGVLTKMPKRKKGPEGRQSEAGDESTAPVAKKRAVPDLLGGISTKKMVGVHVSAAGSLPPTQLSVSH